MKKKILMMALATILAGMNVFADDSSITVRVTGEGENRAEALENALQNAVRKVVGTYVVSQTKVKNEDFEDDVYVNADAVVTQHRELKKTESKGVVTLEIEATVVKNDLLKYVKKTQSTDITSTDTANLLAKRRALQTAEKTIDYIFKDYSLRLYKLKKIGDLDLAPGDDVSSDKCNVIITYEVRFDLEEYARLKQRLQNLFAKVAIKSRTFSFDKCDDRDFREQYEKFWKDSGYDSSLGYRLVSFLDEGTNKTYSLSVSIVPNQIHRKLTSILSCDAAIDFSFDLQHSVKPISRVLDDSVGFWNRPYTDMSGWDETRPIEFHNRMGRNWRSDHDNVWFAKKNYRKSWAFLEQEVEAMRRTTIRVYTGNEARFLKSKNERWDMERLAENGYVPAMISMVENFGRKDEAWYSRAALRNSRHAQMKLGWKNSGLGFSIFAENDDFVVGNVQKGVPVKRDMVLKSINGKPTSPMKYAELAAFIGAIPAGATVKLEFTNGKSVAVKAQD